MNLSFMWARFSMLYNLFHSFIVSISSCIFSLLNGHKHNASQAIVGLELASKILLTTLPWTKWYYILFRGNMSSKEENILFILRRIPLVVYVYFHLSAFKNKDNASLSKKIQLTEQSIFDGNSIRTHNSFMFMGFWEYYNTVKF